MLKTQGIIEGNDGDMDQIESANALPFFESFIDV
jgi:hypothetical protein